MPFSSRAVRFLLLLTLALAFDSAAHAQISLYGTFSDTRLSNNVDGSTGTYWNPGFGAGISVTTLPLGPVSLGLDLRGSSRSGTPGDDTVLAGLKLGARVPFIAFKPYIEAVGGYVRARTPAQAGLTSTTATRGFGAYEILGGIDTPLLSHLDLRMIEIGGGQGIQISGPTSSNISLLTINTGLVVHF